MSDWDIRIYGKEAAETYLRGLQDILPRIESDRTLRVGWNLAYAWGIHFGRRRNGRLARKAGGTFALTRALETQLPRLRDIAIKTLRTHPQDLWAKVYGVAMDIRNEARASTPQVSGELRRNLQIVPTRRPR
jgi:hypothetical protein